MNIKINTKTDERISSLFPNDPYTNLCIITASQKLHLQQAFLAVDSQFFESIEPDTREINFSQYKQEPLIKVLHSLYGAELIVNSISQLCDTFQIIIKLQISDYKSNLLNELKLRKDILQNIEFLQFSFKHKICFEQVLEIHMESRLKLLEDNKNYLQLNKLENQTFNFIILEYLNRYGQSDCKVLNNVMENYFNRKTIKPLAYLKSYDLSQLQKIWLKYHHVSPTELFAVKSSPSIIIDDQIRSRNNTEVLHNRIPQSKVLLQKKKKILELQQDLAYKDTIIQDLSQKISELKLQLGLSFPHKAITAKSFIMNFDNLEVKEQFQKIKKSEFHEYHYTEDKNNYNYKLPEKMVKNSKSRKTLDEIYQGKSSLSRFGARNFKKI